MANKHEDYLVQCPYYKTNDRQVIHCEGFEKGMAMNSAFATHDQLIAWKSRYCRMFCYQQCPVADALNRKWGYNS